ncbi:MAG: GNAT family N-acetyltransferase [Spirochaetaceae bacterium]|nr:MAG: GNAT family N-acetyltransferase [Spirochaetaceae bacterium]
MSSCVYQIEKDISAVPRSLLLLAEPDEAIIDDYSPDCVAVTAVLDSQTVGVAVLLRDHDTIEIINLAVAEERRQRGIASTLLEKAIDYSRDNRVRRLVIRTASTSTQQLLLYQKVGFRFSEIDHGYFTRNYFRPLIENGVRCIDQILLVYPIYRARERRALIEEYWHDFVLRNPEHVGSSYTVWAFGDGARVANKLLNLVIEGKKTATSWALELLALEDKEPPQPGQLSVVSYSDGYPGAIVQTTAVEVHPFNQVDNEHARLEGEGDLSLDHWRDTHRTVFSRELESRGRTFSDTTPVVCERFQLIDVNRELARL